MLALFPFIYISSFWIMHPSLVLVEGNNKTEEFPNLRIKDRAFCQQRCVPKYGSLAFAHCIRSVCLCEDISAFKDSSAHLR